ncbi:YbbR-like domain-containing protein [Loigolactobacillus backii]|uniref:Uncharacterized protein n=1 Tax=Loigolactobacillus backii TaxID=375175 RepID=A0A192H387_9LACO|nr:CdaR family protein [Loigolactobacillus backii]ANK59939.1 hypothetical protein AYR52_06485 [Loigolactobacillus backii]ANK63274.1 hypothetical protein AYR53_11145 [Loigolactobacillus backii]ANK64873.1 hypothetical protein AYR54_06165 [Loigolactobacillus backii]ANK66680.1 hypothetical protein AYR55_02590 [Loigolactobacillus backii]ANK69720.1 hypothetical protein AYR56_05860 [Loigolactobacillus backii]
MNKFFNSPWVYRGLALIFAIMLFTYVNIDRINSTRQAASSSSTMLANKSKTITVPLQINADTDKYFITGYPEKVKVKIEGPSALVTATTNTQNFKVMANLERLGVGKHVVTLRQEGLNKELSYRISPQRVTIDVQRKETKRFPIQVKFNKANLATGYTTGDISLNQTTTTVTGSRSAVNSIEQVVATVNTKNNIESDISQETLLQALDSKGNTVNVLMDPQAVKVTIPVEHPSKKVSINLKATGTPADGKSVKLSSDTKSVTVTGPQSELDKLKDLTVDVPVDDASSSTTKTISLDPGSSNLQCSPKSVQVLVSVSDDGTNNNDTTAESGAASSSVTATSSKNDSSSSTTSSESSSESSQSANQESSSSSSSQSN